MEIIYSFFIALLMILLVVLMFWLTRERRFSGKKFGTAGDSQLRLAMIDAIAVDTCRWLVLIRRENIEHLLMIGGPEDIVVERNVHHPAGVASPHEGHVPRERSLADVMRAVDAAMESEGDLRVPWAKPSSRSEPLLSLARVPEPAA